MKAYKVSIAVPDQATASLSHELAERGVKSAVLPFVVYRRERFCVGAFRLLRKKREARLPQSL